jgi:hypothetical protein
MHPIICHDGLLKKELIESGGQSGPPYTFYPNGSLEKSLNQTWVQKAHLFVRANTVRNRAASSDKKEPYVVRSAITRDEELSDSDKSCLLGS